jgi:hypothetical protein
LLGPFGNFVEKDYDFVCGYGNYLYVSDMFEKTIKQAFIIPQCTFAIIACLIFKKKVMASNNFMMHLPVWFENGFASA